MLADEPDVLASVLAMLKADDASAMLPTLPPEPASLDDLDHVMPERIGNYRIGRSRSGAAGWGWSIAPRAMMACSISRWR